MAPPADNQVRAADDPGMPPALTYWGIFVGLLLAAAGGAATVFFSMQVPQALAVLTMCVGFGIVLAAFGSRAGGNWGGFVVVGSAALAVVLFILVQRYIPQFEKHWQIGGDLSKVADLQIVDDEPLYSRRDRNTHTIRFVVLNRQFKSKNLYAIVDTTEKGDGQEFFRMVASSSDLAKYLSDDATWTLDYQHHAIKDGQKTLFAVPDVIDERNLAASVPLNPASREWSFLIRRAMADESPGLTQLIKDLSNDDPAVRRNAREGLSSLGLPGIAPMMASWQQAPDDYRLKYGVTSTLAAVLRNNIDSRPAISAALGPNDLSLLVRATGDDDSSIRFQATDFLYNLKDPRIVTPALDQASSAASNYNSVLILKNVYQMLPPSQKSEVSTQLNASSAGKDARSRALIDSFTGTSAK